MSYSLTSKCWDCVKEARCTDRHVIGGAIQGIHFMPNGKDFGHLGYGIITLECGAYEKKPEPNKSSDVQPQVADWHGQGKETK